VVFSTNLAPDALMDPAFLRRIPYKIELGAPSVEEYRRIFRLVAEGQGLELSEAIVSFVIEQLKAKGGIPLACYQPKFILDQIVASCRFDGLAPRIGEEFLNRLPSEFHELVNCHDARARQVEHHILVSCHCTMKSELPITQIHDVTAVLEDRVKERFPQIFRVTIHPEPFEEK
jgi:divalent metal cation (Fe/Co/Zn/Cd) transporter